jgi:adenosylcobinamide-GDP ribazoletransferase
MAEGWGSQHAVSMAAGVLVLSSLALWFVAGPGLLVVLALVIAAVYFCWRRLWQQRIGGFTGDTAGAMIELQEVAVLLILIQV